jgi:hypothetical protein
MNYVIVEGLLAFTAMLFTKQFLFLNQWETFAQKASDDDPEMGITLGFRCE